MALVVVNLSRELRSGLCEVGDHAMLVTEPHFLIDTMSQESLHLEKKMVRLQQKNHVKGRIFSPAAGELIVLPWKMRFCFSCVSTRLLSTAKVFKKV